MKQEEQEVAPVVAPHQKRGPAAKPTTKSLQRRRTQKVLLRLDRGRRLRLRSAKSLSPRPSEVTTSPPPTAGGLRPRKIAQGAGGGVNDRANAGVTSLGRPAVSKELHPKAAPSSRRPRTPSRSPPSVHTPEDQSSSGGAPRGDTTRFRGTSLELASGQEDRGDTTLTPPQPRSPKEESSSRRRRSRSWRHRSRTPLPEGKGKRKGQGQGIQRQEGQEVQAQKEESRAQEDVEEHRILRQQAP